jgi:hypothetical protein
LAAVVYDLALTLLGIDDTVARTFFAFIGKKAPTTR